ncbi:MAG: hypothetical protein Fur0016_33250 [Anaerolineales bacterium]
MKILLDMNLPPRWVEVLQHGGWEAIHWSQVGDPRAADDVIMEWARQHGFVIFTHDLDFGALLALTRAKGPSVIQVRAQDIFPEALADILLPVLKRHEKNLEQGALLTVDPLKARLRLLPLR